MRIAIRSIPFTIREPYAPGQILGPAEAKKLNLERGENIRKNLLRLGFMKDLAEIPTAEEFQRLRAFLAEYDARYELPDSEQRGGTSGLEEELYQVALERVKERVKGEVVGRREFEEMVLGEMDEVECYREARERWIGKAERAKTTLADLLA